MHNLTQEEVAGYLGITAQSVSKWERGESCPDITLLPALANIFETSIDLLMGMDTIRAEETMRRIHKTAVEHQRTGDYTSAEATYRDALRFYPNDPGLIFGLASTLALGNDAQNAIDLIIRGLSLSRDEKHKATMRAVLCLLYLQAGQESKARSLASALPHARECREAIQPLVQQELSGSETQEYIRRILLGDGM